jgi:hypothetical protein
LAILGTLVPFVVAYLAVLKMDASSVLFAFGISMLVCGSVYRTPIPVQPMKAAGAIATTQAAQTITLTARDGSRSEPGHRPHLADTRPDGHGKPRRQACQRPIVVGIVLGLGFGFMIEGRES